MDVCHTHQDRIDFGGAERAADQFSVRFDVKPVHINLHGTPGADLVFYIRPNRETKGSFRFKLAEAAFLFEECGVADACTGVGLARALSWESKERWQTFGANYVPVDKMSGGKDGGQSSIDVGFGSSEIAVVGLWINVGDPCANDPVDLSFGRFANGPSCFANAACSRPKVVS